MIWRRKRRRAAEAEDRRRLRQTEEDLSTVRRQWPAVRDAAETMDRHRQENNFAHKIRLAMGVRDA